MGVEGNIWVLREEWEQKVIKRLYSNRDHAKEMGKFGELSQTCPTFLVNLLGNPDLIQQSDMVWQNFRNIIVCSRFKTRKNILHFVHAPSNKDNSIRKIIKVQFYLHLVALFQS